MSKNRRNIDGRGGARKGAGRPPGGRFGESTTSIRIPLSAARTLRLYLQAYSDLRRQIIQSDLHEELASTSLDGLGNFWSWLVRELSESRDVIDIKGYFDSSQARSTTEKRSYRKYSSVAATPAVFGFGEESSCEEIRIDDLIVENPRESYIVDVVGDSMIDFGIREGTWLIVQEYNKSHLELEGGELVVVSFSGSSSSSIVKIYHKDEYNRIFFISANHNYPAIVIDEKEYDRFLINGVVKKIISNPARMSISQRERYISGF